MWTVIQRAHLWQSVCADVAAIELPADDRLDVKMATQSARLLRRWLHVQQLLPPDPNASDAWIRPSARIYHLQGAPPQWLENVHHIMLRHQEMFRRYKQYRAAHGFCEASPLVYCRAVPQSDLDPSAHNRDIKTSPHVCDSKSSAHTCDSKTSATFGLPAHPLQSSSLGHLPFPSVASTSSSLCVRQTDANNTNAVETHCLSLHISPPSPCSADDVGSDRDKPTSPAEDVRAEKSSDPLLCLFVRYRPPIGRSRAEGNDEGGSIAHDAGLHFPVYISSSKLATLFARYQAAVGETDAVFGLSYMCGEETLLGVHQQFVTRVWTMLQHYVTFGKPGQQCAVPDLFFRELAQTLGVDHECCASPLNAYLAGYCCANPCADSPRPT